MLELKQNQATHIKEGTPSSVVSLQMKEFEDKNSLKDIIGPYEQGLKDIDNEIDQEKIQNMILSERIAGLKP